MFEAMKGSRKLLVDRVVEQITQLVIEQDLEAGDKLPNEYELAERLNVGRGTVREAVKTARGPQHPGNPQGQRYLCHQQAGGLG